MEGFVGGELALRIQSFLSSLTARAVFSSFLPLVSGSAKAGLAFMRAISFRVQVTERGGEDILRRDCPMV